MNELQSKNIAELQQLFEAQKVKSLTVRETTAAKRIEKIKSLYEETRRRQGDIEAALYEDLRKCPEEARITELYPMYSSCRRTMRKLPHWMRPKRVMPPLALAGSRCRVTHLPKGVCLIMSPWNYPFELSISPVVYAIAAGNCVILKPSEYSPAVSKVIIELLGAVFNNNEVAVVEGGPETGQALTQMPFDHIFFTGSPQVGSKVMQAAAANLTSVTLELGGKSPVIVDETADLAHAAEKIVWGKIINSGQTCIAPDYVLVHESHMDKFIDAMKLNIEKFIGTEDSGIDTPHYARIINDQHYQRLKNLFDDAVEKGASIVTGGRFDPEQRFISPAVLTGLPGDADIMSEEIFGPVLPVFSYRTREEPVEQIRSRPAPLVLYLFSGDENNIDYFVSSTVSGDVLINDTIVHYGNTKLPFGGTGYSGIGKTHAEYGFKEFSHTRSVMKQPQKSLAGLVYPPYNGFKRKLIDMLLDYF